MAYLMEIEVAAPPPSAARRHAEIVVERQKLRASGRIRRDRGPRHGTGQDRRRENRYAQQRIMALADTASAGKREPQLVADMLEAHIDRSAAMVRRNCWADDGLPDLTGAFRAARQRGFDHPRRAVWHGQDNAGDEHCGSWR